MRIHYHQLPVLLTLCHGSHRLVLLYNSYSPNITLTLFLFPPFNQTAPYDTYTMFTKALIVVLSASSLVAGHGKPVSFVGDGGGNGTALAIQGGIIAATGPNSKVRDRCNHKMRGTKLIKNAQRRLSSTPLYLAAQNPLVMAWVPHLDQAKSSLP